MSQSLRRLEGGQYATVDPELVIICTQDCCLASPHLIGLAFLTRTSGWRVLRSGLADIGYTPDAEIAISRIIDDAARHGPRVIDLPEDVRRALPL